MFTNYADHWFRVGGGVCFGLAAAYFSRTPQQAALYSVLATVGGFAVLAMIAPPLTLDERSLQGVRA